MRARLAAATALLGACGLAGCMTSHAQAPAWFQERSAARDATYPNLRDVPHGTIANTNPQHWAQVQADLDAGRAQLDSNPRSQPATEPEDPNGFVAQAQQELDQARQSHSDSAPH